MMHTGLPLLSSHCFWFACFFTTHLFPLVMYARPESLSSATSKHNILLKPGISASVQVSFSNLCPVFLLWCYSHLPHSSVSFSIVWI